MPRRSLPHALQGGAAARRPLGGGGGARTSKSNNPEIIISSEPEIEGDIVLENQVLYTKPLPLPDYPHPLFSLLNTVLHIRRT